jgi:DNA polymerase
MSSGLEAIANELRRLQRDGVNRVFVEDATMQLIAQGAENAQKPSSTQHTSRPTKGNAGLPDLRELIKEPSNKTVTSNEAQQQKTKTTKAPPLPKAPKIELPAGDAATQLAWLREQVLACQVCQAQLNEGAKIVFGAGSPNADILFCCEAPGADEESAGEPLVGKAGELLTKIIAAMGLTREDVYITNILKWRPQHNKPYGNRPPTVDEMRFCLPYLQAQIKAIKPKVIVALGNATVTGLLGPDPTRKMADIRGTWAQFNETPVIITFHPSYLLRNGTLKTKRMAWEDMLQVMEKCSLEISEKQRNFFLPKK